MIIKNLQNPIKNPTKIRKNLFEAVELEDLQDLNKDVANGGISSDYKGPGEAGSAG